jgi:PAS domain S-box-containing protein
MQMANLSIDAIATYINTEPLTVTPEMPVKKAIALLEKTDNQTNCLLVVESERLVGLIAAKDFVLATKRPKWASLKVADLMQRDFFWLQASDLTDINAVIDNFRNNRMYQLPVVNQEEELIGLIGIESLVEVLQTAAKSCNIQLEKQIPTMSSDITARKTAEEKLRQSEERFRQLSDATFEGIIIHRNGNIIDINQALIDLFGYSRDQLITMHPLDLIAPESRQVFQQNMEAKSEQLYEVVGCKKDDSKFMLEIQTRTLIYQGDPVRVKVFRDITAHKQTEIALKDSQIFIQKIADTTPGILYIYDLIEQRNIYVNREIGEVLGYAPEQIQQMGNNLFVQIMHPEDLVKITAYFEQFNTLEDGKSLGIEYRMRHANGEWRWLYSRDAVFTRTPDGNPTQLLGTAIDISEQQAALRERKHAEATLTQLNQDLECRVIERTQKLEQLQERLQFLLASSPAVIFTCEPMEDYRISYISDNITTILGYQPVEFTTDCNFWVNHIHPEDVERILTELSGLFETGHHIHEYRFLHQDGSYRWVRSELKLLRDERDNPIEIIGYSADISDRKRAEIAWQQQLERERIISAIATKVRQSLQLEEILSTTVAELQQVLQADRVLVYQIFPNGNGRAIAEATSSQCQPILNIDFPSEVFPKENYDRYLQGRICALSDRNTANISPCLVKFLYQLDVQAKLVVPIINPDKIWGLLIAHHCNPRRWQDWEISLFKQLANQVAIAIQQSSLYAQLQAELNERKQAEENLKNSLKEKEILFKEIHHRVKNNLYVVSSLLELQSDTISDPQIAKLFEESQNRIYSMALIHEKLYRSQNIAQVNFGDYLQDLVDHLFDTYNVSQDRIEVKIDTDPIFLNIETAAPCGLIVNELVSNTMKHAFPNERTGMVCVECHQDGAKQIHLAIRDNGIGFPPDLNFRTTDSMGFQVVCTLIEQLEATIELESDRGTSFHIKFFELQYSKRV